jgi:glycosyltransferase involved in cell wall biosynthesis
MTAGGGKRILMLLGNNPYPQDPRVRQEATSLTRAGFDVTVVAPRAIGQPRREEIDGVRVVRPMAFLLGRGSVSYAVEHMLAAVVALISSMWVAATGGFDIVHVHNPPDTLGLVALGWKALGKSFVFDHHDLAPEIYAARSNGHGSALVSRTLSALEALCCRYADLVLATNESYRNVDITQNGTRPERIDVVRNGPELDRYPLDEPDDALREGAEEVVCYAGVVGRLDGVDLLVRAVDELVSSRHEKLLCLVVGGGDGLLHAQALASELGIADRVRFTGTLPFEELLARVAVADVCVEPAPSNPYNDRSTMIKLLEYMASGKPVVAFDLPEHRVTGGDAVRYARPNDHSALAEAVGALLDDPAESAQRGAAGRARVEQQLSWAHSERNLLLAYATLPGGAT